MKILVVNIPTGKPDTPFGDWARDEYCALLDKNFGLVKRPDTEITYRFAEWGMNPIEMAYYRCLDHVAGQMVFHAAKDADKEGFDAVLINCFGDPMVAELRQWLDIPVVAIGEASMAFATMMCNKFGLAHVSPLNIPETDEHIVRYGYKDKYLTTRPFTNWDQMSDEDDLHNCRPKLSGVLGASHQLIEDGAELIIPACSITSPMMRFTPGAEDDYPNGVTEVDGVPVLDVEAIAFLMAESWAALKLGGSSWISRKGMYRTPPERVKEHSKPITHGANSDMYKFWDVPGK